MPWSRANPQPCAHSAEYQADEQPGPSLWMRQIAGTGDAHEPGDEEPDGEDGKGLR